MKIILSNFFKSISVVFKVIIFEWKGLLLSALLGVSSYIGYISLFEKSYLFISVIIPLIYIGIWQTRKITKAFVMFRSYLEESNSYIESYILKNQNVLTQENLSERELVNKLFFYDIVKNGITTIALLSKVLLALYLLIIILTILSIFLPLFHMLVLVIAVFDLYILVEYSDKYKVCLDICNGKIREVELSK